MGDIMKQSKSNIWVAIIGAMTVVLSILGSFYIWHLNEKSKWQYEDYIRIEAKYTALLKAARGFYLDIGNKQLRVDFIEQFDQCWLYCPDNVIKAGNKFLLMQIGENHPQDSLKSSMRNFILEMRKDLFSKQKEKNTNLKADDFQILTAN
jgi:hypothetical protein